MSLLGCNFPKMALKQTTLSVHNKFNSVSHTCFNFPKRMNLSQTRKLTTCCSFWKGKMESHCDAIATVRCIKCQKLCYSTASSRSLYATNSGIVQSVHNNFVLPISTKLKHHSWYVSNNNLHTTAGLSVIPKDIYINPITDLQRLYEIPLLPEMQEIFRPSAQDMRNGEQLFVPSHKNKIKYLSGAVDQDHLPSHDLPEVAFIGRSNVGKSSLIKALFRKVPDLKIRTSKTPGHTRALIFFEVGQLMSVVDMPGYGFHMPTHFVTSVEAYLKSRKNLKMTFHIIDAKIGPTQSDDAFHAKLNEFGIPFTMILTKIDKVKETTLLRNLLKVNQYREEETQCCLQQIFLLSSITYSGIPLLQAFIGHVTGNLMLESK